MKRWIVGFIFSLWVSAASAGVTCSLPFNLQNGTTADASQVMANYNALVVCLGNAAAAGANNDITALLGLTTPIPPSGGGSSVFFGGAVTGTANAITFASPAPTGFTLVTGYTVIFVASLTNTGVTTLEVASQTVTATTNPACSTGTCPPSFYNIGPNGPVPMIGGEIQANQIVIAQWDGSEFECTNCGGVQYGGVGPLTNLASATTTDLGTVSSHNVSITGSTTITSFGQTATTTYPNYQVTFTSPLTITWNQTSCATVGGCIQTPGAANIAAAAGDTAVAVYLGKSSGGLGNWAITNYMRANGTAVVNPTPLCGAVGLAIYNDTGTPNTKIDITAGSAVLINPTGNVPIYVTGVSVAINDTINGANGLDAVSLGNNTMYNHYLISNGTTTAGLDSASATSPTMPSGYIYLCRLGASKTNGSANFYGFRTTGAVTQYVNGGANLSTLPVVAQHLNGGTSCGTTSTTPTWAAETIAGTSGVAPLWAPSTATDVELVLVGADAASAAATCAAPNNTYESLETPNPPPLGLNTAVTTATGWMKLETATIYVSINGAANGLVQILAYKDNVNAN